MLSVKKIPLSGQRTLSVQAIRTNRARVSAHDFFCFDVVASAFVQDLLLLNALPYATGAIGLVWEQIYHRSASN